MERPRLLRFLLWIVFIQAAVYFTYFALYVINVMERLDFIIIGLMRGERGPQGVIGLALLISTWLVLAVTSVVAGVGLRRGRPWAWVGALTVEGAILVLSLATYFSRQANELFYIAMALAVAIVLLLNQRDLQVFFKADRTTVD